MDLPSIHRALHHVDPNVRLAAVQSLAAVTSPEALEPLCGRLLDPHPGVRRSAAEALRKREDPRAGPALCSALRVRDADVLVAVLRALGAVKDPGSIAAVAQVLRDPARPSPARIAAAWALRDLQAPGLNELLEQLVPWADAPMRRAFIEIRARSGDLRLVPKLQADLPNARLDPAERVLAVRCLGWLRAAEAVPHLLELLEETETPRSICCAVVRCLGLFPDAGVSEALVRVLAQPDALLRREALMALARMGDPQLLRLLPERLLDPEEAATVRLTAATLLGAMRDGRTDTPFPQATAALVAALYDPEEEVLTAVVKALGAHGAIGPLCEAVRSRCVDVRYEAINQLAGTGSPEVVEVVDSLRADPEPRVRVGVLNALGSLAPDAAETGAALRDALHDPDVEVRRTAVTHFGSAGEVEALCQGLRDQDPGVTRTALTYLARHRDGRATKAVAALLAHADPEIRGAAVAVLGGIGTPEALAVVALTAREPDPGVRRAAVRTLGTAGVVEPLYLALRDRSQEVRQEAVHHLGLLADPGAVRTLLGMVQEPDALTRAAAAAALGVIGSPEALPVLRRRLRPLIGERNRYALQALRAAVEQIEARRAAVLPIPGRAVAVTGETLPRPVGGPQHPETGLPRIPRDPV